MGYVCVLGGVGVSVMWGWVVMVGDGGEALVVVSTVVVLGWGRGVVRALPCCIIP